MPRPVIECTGLREVEIVDLVAGDDGRGVAGRSSFGIGRFRSRMLSCLLMGKLRGAFFCVTGLAVGELDDFFEPTLFLKIEGMFIGIGGGLSGGMSVDGRPCVVPVACVDQLKRLTEWPLSSTSVAARFAVSAAKASST